MSRGSNRRIPASYLDEVLPTLNSMIGGSAGQLDVERSARKEVGAKMRKVHFYIDGEDYEKLEDIVAKLASKQELFADRRGLTSKVLRMAVKLGLREIEAKVSGGSDSLTARGGEQI